MLVCHGDTPCDGNYIQLMIIWYTSLTTGLCLNLCNLITLTWSALASELLKSLGRLFNVEIDGKDRREGGWWGFCDVFQNWHASYCLHVTFIDIITIPNPF